MPCPSLNFFDRAPTSDLETTWTSGSNSAESVCWHFKDCSPSCLCARGCSLPLAKFRLLLAGTRARRPGHHVPRSERNPGGIRMAHLHGLVGKGHTRAALAAGVRYPAGAASDSVSRD